MPTSAATGTKHKQASGASKSEVEAAQKEAAEAERRAEDAELRAHQAEEKVSAVEREALANPQGVDLEEVRAVERSDYVPDDSELRERDPELDEGVHRSRIRQLDDGTSIREVQKFGSHEWEQDDAVKVYPKAVYPVDEQNPPQPKQDDPEAYT